MKFYEVKDHDGVTVDCHFSKKVANIAADEINGTVSMIDVDVSKALLYFDADEQIQPLGVIGATTSRTALAAGQKFIKENGK